MQSGSSGRFLLLLNPKRVWYAMQAYAILILSEVKV